MDINIREHQLPGLGRRYDLDLTEGRVLGVIVQNDGQRKLTVRDRDADAPLEHISLAHEEAIAVAALLSGARFSIESDTTPDDAVSPAAGPTASDEP